MRVYFFLALLSHNDLRYFTTSPNGAGAYGPVREFVFSDPVGLSS
jgi:hypothetical protein